MKNTFENFDLDSSLEFMERMKGISQIDVRSIPGKKYKKSHQKNIKPESK